MDINYLPLIHLPLSILLCLHGLHFWFYKPIFQDPAKRHVSIAYGFVAAQIVQIWFYLSVFKWVDTTPLEILKIALAVFLVLILLSIRRVNIEAVNEIIELRRGKSEDF